MPIDVIYDCETFPNFFSCAITPLAKDDNTTWTYEISSRRNDAPTFAAALKSRYFRRMYGFYSLNFDSPLVHAFLKMWDAGIRDAMTLYTRLKALAQEIIAAGNRWSHRVHWRDEVAKQVDLFLIHHFDNPSRSTSLKTLQFNMRTRRVQDLPFHHSTVLEPWQMDVVRDYGLNDISSTKDFAWETMPMIEFREKLGDKHLNDNDTKIGKSFVIAALEKRWPGICYDSNRQPRQTWRSTVDLGECIFPWITFEHPEARAVLDRLKSTVLRADEITTGETGAAKVATKGVFKDLTATLDGFKFVFGTGGIHGSVINRIIKADATHEIADIDVKAFYPSIAIVNKIYPEHLGPGFVDVYAELKAERTTAQQAGDMVKSDALKLGNNGVYGESNNYYGPFLDPKYTMTVTVNGQLMLVMLGGELQKIPGLEIIQANTDGMTLRFPRSQRARFDAVCAWWQHGTGMELEEAQYSRMWIRDVNSYIAEYSSGKKAGTFKRKGAYDYELKVGDQKAWHKDHSSLVIQKAANAALCDDHDPLDFIRHHQDPWDFLIREKVTGATRLVLADGTPCQQTTRYYVAHDGLPMFKIMPPLAKAPDKPRKMSIHAEGQAIVYGAKANYHCSICGDHGPAFKFKKEFEEHNTMHHTFKVKVCNVYDGEPLAGLNLDYYLRETEKLLLQ
ncbi:MAG TPA: hypothetical protein VMT30_06210 [Candidatus Saccharimonadia bacterium]|nr:hypothetical protein [Candidatus Saccharimonadia bacterium]